MTMYTLQFDAADLACNQQGYLSDRQRQRVEADAAAMRRQARQMLWFLAGFGVFVLVIGGIIEFLNAGGDLERLVSSGILPGLAVVVLLLGFIGVVSALYSRSSARRYSRGSIRTVEGVARLVTGEVYVRSMRVQQYNLELRQGAFRKFTFRFQNAESLAYFKEGRRYRVYYLPYVIPQALSAERLDVD